MALSQNSFKQEPKKGLKYRDTGDTIQAMIVDADPDKEFVAGEAMIITNVAGSKIVNVAEGADNLSDYSCIILDNQLKSVFKSGDVVEVALVGGQVIVEASGAVTGGLGCEYDPATKKFITATLGKPVVRALTGAAADGDLFVAQIGVVLP